MSVNTNKSEIVIHEGGRVYLADVPRPKESCSTLSVLAAALQQRGEDITYTQLMGHSSRAFRLQFSWCPSSPHACVGFDTMKPAQKAAGYRMIPLHAQFYADEGEHRDATEQEREESLARIRAAIDRGESVGGGSEEDFLIVGYEPKSEENPTGLLRRPGPVGGPPQPNEPYLQPVKHLPWGLALLEKADTKPSVQESATWALRMAVLNAERGTVEGSDLAIGFAAWEKWIKELEPKAFQAVVDETDKQLKEMGRAKENALWGICLGNAWSYENLFFARFEAARYLREIAPDMPEASHPHLLAAADAYEKVHHALVPKGECFTKIAPYPFMLKNVKAEWTDELRARQAQLLTAGLVHEREAVSELKKALQAMNLELAHE